MNVVSLKWLYFCLYYCVFSPAVAQILVGRLYSCFLTHIKKYMTPIYASIFEKHVKMCLYKTYQKARVNSLCFWGIMHSKNKLAGRSFFQNLSSQGPGRRELEGSALDFFCSLFWGFMGFNCVSKVWLESQCKNYGIWKGKIKPHLGKVCIFLPTLFYKNHRNIVLWWSSW